ncbi:ATP-binding cassette sub-family G member 4-like [Aphidius gifuensis]|uniref:ATP-binding cassette sub-family G member 4-like n=1 Tax=Aphidius gifuensis TaxID=684658 RepID=UPI001CDD24EB|nr:ATP-binding cassette sub-family G member 4-like [Aphidius gifuensis]XP_044008069.1 ATP-binding cassette sub-family G member 4-like [Aphidius gifuensis]
MYQRIVFVDVPKTVTFDIDFRNVKYEVNNGFRQKKKSILNGVSGCFKSGQLTAIMGPSGAGKSSLLNLLTGFKDANFKGSIQYINDSVEQSDKKKYDNYMKTSCYIQQDDQLFRLFTVIETMEIAANLKLGNSLNKKSKNILINDILENLDLVKTKETRCDRLSGGQKKRLSIALELIDNPPVMFLDEPTTGLDSSSTLQCIAMLQNLAHDGRTIIATIHQPSAAIYGMFDHIYLLADGYCMYQGAPENTIPFFKNIGLHCPKYHNPADFMIEVVSKEYGNYNKQLLIAAENGTSLWRTAQFVKKSIFVDTVNKTRYIDDKKAIVLVTPPSELLRFFVLFKRCLIQLYRDWTVTHLKLILHFLVGILLGLFFVDAGTDGSKTINNVGFLLITIVYLCYTSMMPAVLRFPSELPVLKKEKFNNWYKLKTYYAAFLFSNIPIQILFALVYTSVSYFLSSQPLDPNRFFMFLITAILTALLSESIGLVLGTTVNPINGTFLGAIYTCGMLLFAGFLVFFKHMPVSLYYVSYLSYMRYALEALVQSIYGLNRENLTCPKHIDYCHYRMPSNIMKELSMPDGRFWINISILSATFVILRFVGYCTLRKKLSCS